MERRDVRHIIAALGIYFLLQIVIRLLVSPELELDEAEQLLLTQQLSLGYGSQPPLYTWLLSGLFSIFGVNIFSLALLKNVLLFCTYLLMYRAGRGLGYNRATAVAAMLSLLFIPQIAWESQRDLTHSVLAVTLAAATIVCWVRLKQDQGIVSYLLVGLCWGAGLLGKYNYGIFLVGLLAASLTISDYRTVILRSRMLYALGVMLAVVAPHVIWAATHVQQLMTSSGKFKLAAQNSYIASVLKGSGSLIVAAVSFAGPLLLIYGLIWYRRHRLRSAPLMASHAFQSPNLLLRSIGASFLICLLMVLFFKVTAFKDRWMQPILFFLPLALMSLMGQVFEECKARVVQIFAGGIACIILAGMAARPLLAPVGGTLTRFNLPYGMLVAQIGPSMQAVEMVVAHNVLVGGTIRLQYPQVRVTVPGGSRLYHDASPKRLLAVWQEELGDRPSDEQLKGFWSLVTAMAGDRPLIVPYETVRAPYHYLAGRTMSLSSALVLRHPSAP